MGNPKLSQIVAVEKGLKARTLASLTDLHKLLQKAPLYSGISRVYTPKDDEGEKLPPENTRLQRLVETDLEEAADMLTQLFNAVHTKEEGNRLAKADIVVGETTLMKDVSVPYLLFLEKQLTDWRTLVTKIPVRDTADVWSEGSDRTAGARTEPVSTIRTKKVPKVLHKADATDRHPAQVEVYYEDVPVGTWATTKFSGAVDGGRRDVLIRRANTLIDAVKSAREAANGTEIEQKTANDPLFEYLLKA